MNVKILGMRASVHIDFPGWTKEGLDALKKRCNELSLQPRGTRGESWGQTGKRNRCLICIKFLETGKNFVVLEHWTGFF